MWLNRNDYREIYYTRPDLTGLVLTNEGLFNSYQCEFTGSLCITPNRVERNYLVFNTFPDFWKWVKDECIKKEVIDETTGDSYLEVGWIVYRYTTKYGTLDLSKGLWMDNAIHWKQGKLLQSFDCADQWLKLIESK